MLCQTAAAVALLFVELHGPTGQRLYVNTAEISTLREPIETSAHWAKGVRCVIIMTNGKFLAVAENCPAVRDKLTEHK